MFKKIISIILTFVLIVSCTIAINSENKNVPSEPDSLQLTSEYIQIIPQSPAQVERLFDAPDEILSATTQELLNYFMNSDFIRECILADVLMSDCQTRSEMDYTRNKAFRELISRDDFVLCLNNYVKTISDDCIIDDCFNYVTELNNVLKQPSVKKIVSEAITSSTDYQSIQNYYGNNAAETSSAGDYVGTIGDINYYSAGTINTANNRSVEVCTPHRNLTQSEITNINEQLSSYGNTLLYSPSSVYNCHSYAWYSCSSSNPYWIMDISEFLLDGACSAININSIQVNDIVVYLDDSGNELHSGVVQSISSSGDLTIRSKWGQAGVYIHPIENVPSAYCRNSNTNEILVCFFRYHDYTYQYLGDEYHSGSMHYFKYANVCDICNNQTNIVWESVPCDGPPCSIIHPASRKIGFEICIYDEVKIQ